MSDIFGSYADSVEIIETLIGFFELTPCTNEERESAINALRAARAAILAQRDKEMKNFTELYKLPKNSSLIGDMSPDEKLAFKKWWQELREESGHYDS